jgi:predicted membrane chloride channel (bestrophin family)
MSLKKAAKTVKLDSVKSSIYQAASRIKLDMAAKKIKKLQSKSGSSYKYTWKQLASIDKRRRAIIDQVEEPFWKCLFHWHGTVLELLVQDSLFWITILIYVGVRLQARLGELPDYLTDMSSSNIGAIGAFLSFFLVFYLNRTYIRYMYLYDQSMAPKGRIFDTATLAATTLPKEVGTRLIRYMNAAHIAGYTGLSKTYSKDSFFNHLNKEFGLVTDEELARLTEIDLEAGLNCSRELTTWCMMEIQVAYKKGILDSELANLYRTQILQMRAAIGKISDAADLPIPFFYVHFICLLSAMYLPLFAVNGAYNAGIGSETYWTADVTAGLIVVLQSIFVIGLRILGQKLSDPYGDDSVDFSVIYFVTCIWQMSNRILNSQFPSEVDAQVEESICRERVSIGKAWETEEKGGGSKLESASDEFEADIAEALSEEVEVVAEPVSRFAT